MMFKKLVALGSGALLLAGLVACGQQSDSSSPGTAKTPAANLDPTSPTAEYNIIFTAQWTTDFGSPVPGNAHFSPPVGAAVSVVSDLWQPGGQASAGLESLAETGATGGFISEIQAEVTGGKAKGVFQMSSTPNGGGGSVVAQFVFDSNFDKVTFASMAAPTPDWFVGLSKYELKDSNGWKPDETIPLRLYDAGTEGGNGFSLNNSPTDPQGTIERLNETIANGTVFSQGLVNGKAIATIRFQRVK